MKPLVSARCVLALIQRAVLISGVHILTSKGIRDLLPLIWERMNQMQLLLSTQQAFDVSPRTFQTYYELISLSTELLFGLLPVWLKAVLTAAQVSVPVCFPFLHTVKIVHVAQLLVSESLIT